MQQVYAPPPLEGSVVLVIDATTGIGRIVTTRLCAAGAAVAVVGAQHRGRGDDAATNAAFLCKELADIGLDRPALPGRHRTDTTPFRALPGLIAADLNPVAISIVVIPSEPGAEEPDGGRSAPCRRRSPPPAGRRRAHRDRHADAPAATRKLARSWHRLLHARPHTDDGSVEPADPVRRYGGSEHVHTHRCRR